MGLQACGDGTGPTPGGSARLTVLSGGEAQDTIDARLAAPLLVEVRDSAGRTRAGIVVSFTPTSREGVIATTRVAPLEGGYPYWTQLADTTDSNGRAGMQVILGGATGAGGVVVAVPKLGLETTVPYTILPGAFALLDVQPADTAVFVGHSYTLRGRRLDRRGNVLDANVAFGDASPGISVTPAGVVTGVAVGREQAYGRSGLLATALHVSVVPVGTIAAASRRSFVGDSIGVAVVNLDGSGWRQVLVETQPRSYDSQEPPGHDMPARWDPTGTRLVYHEVSTSGALRVLLCALDSMPRRLLATGLYAGEQQPDYARDGQWIYFSGRRNGDYQTDIWRVHPDGTGVERVTDGTDGLDKVRPSISPDGRWLAYVASGHVWVRELGSGATTSFTGPGTSPRFSPGNDLVAYVNSGDNAGYSGQLRVARRDGTGDRLVTSAAAYGPVVDWSPDGKYLIGAHDSYGGLDLIDVATGAVIPLPNTWRLSDPAWRR